MLWFVSWWCTAMWLLASPFGMVEFLFFYLSTICSYHKTKTFTTWVSVFPVVLLSAHHHYHHHHPYHRHHRRRYIISLCPYLHQLQIHSDCQFCDFPKLLFRQLSTVKPVSSRQLRKLTFFIQLASIYREISARNSIQCRSFLQ